MFSEPKKKNFPVYIIKHKETQEQFECSLTPKHYFSMDSAIYTIKFMDIPEYEAVEVEYNPNEDIYE
jgi:hypothetical protein